MDFLAATDSGRFLAKQAKEPGQEEAEQKEHKEECTGGA
jgi:hypothetical protein